MIHIIITAYGEPKATERAVNAFLSQDIPKPFKIIVVDPFPEVRDFIKEKFKDKIEFFLDPGEGKSYALNLLLNNIHTGKQDDIIISTDGDVYVNNIAVEEILEKFKDKDIGVVCGHPVSINPRNNIYGYWSHLLLYEMNKTRKKSALKKQFFEASGYLFAFRNIIKEFPMGACEDNVIPILFWKNGYKIAYAENAEVSILNPQNKKDWILQKKRNLKGHIALKNLPDLQINLRKNTMFGEAFRGLKLAFSYPKNLKEFYWYWILMFTRLKIWMDAMRESKSKEKQYKDGWREEETGSTKPFD